jgi:general secretion pathway protein L
VNWFQTVVGIDPSGKRLALAAVRAGFGRPALCAPPQVSTLRGEKEQQLLSEAEGILGDFVARNGLAGSAARLCVPADRVYSARVLFPPIREKDLRPALELELERLFPFPSSRLRFGWQRLAAKAGGGKNVTLVVMAAQADYIEWWEDIVSRAGLRLGGAIPSGWALSSALSFANQGRWDQRRLTAVFREAGETVECSVLAGRVPVFSAYRQCAAESMPAEGLSLLTEGLVDVPFPEDDAAVDLVAPPGWFGAEDGETGGKISFRVAGDFSPFPAFPTDGQGGAEETVPAGKIAGAFGAAVAEKAIDLAAPGKESTGSRLARVSAVLLTVAAVLLALAWPAATYWKTKGELSRLDAEIAALRPVVADVEEAVGTLREVEAKISLLREASAGRGESFVILKELTERLPDGTWLTGLRVEDRKVEMNGISPSANEIFPLLTRDGRFRGVTFASPITRQADNLERFRIRAEFVPGSAPDEEGAR